MQIIDLGKLRFNFAGAWAANTSYELNDVVTYANNTYVYTNPTTATGISPTEESSWTLMVQGGNNATSSEYVYYVAPHGVDGDGYGESVLSPFASVKYACKQVALLSGHPTASIFVKTGTYYEQLPIVVPPNCAIFGDNQRTTSIHPKAGVASDWIEINYTGINGSTSFTVTTTITGGTSGATAKIMFQDSNNDVIYCLPIAGTFVEGESIISATAAAEIVSISEIDNENAFMFLMSNGTLLQFCNIKGMTGWEPGSTKADITTSKVKGVGFALNPESPIVSASPYILDTSAFLINGIGAYVDGTMHTIGNKSMLFHAFTNINDNGVGYWTRHGATAELVSCFTYYAYFGYSSTEGGWVRSLNGSNSWGTYGVYSRGYLPTEVPVTGSVYGGMLSVGTISGTIAVGDTITGGTSNATGTVTSVQNSSGKLYYKATSGTFATNELITATSGGTVTISSTAGSVGGQKGVLIVLSGLGALPEAGASIQFSGASNAYVIQSVSGSYTNSSSKITVTLSSEPEESFADGTGATIRYKYSQVRLTGHDFLNVGTGGISTTNLPNSPTQSPSQGNQVNESYPGRVFYASTDQSGNFSVGKYFSVNQATGAATLNASAFNLSGLTALRLGSVGAQLGEMINEFSSDSKFSANSNDKCPTEAAVRSYFTNIDTAVDGTHYTQNLFNSYPTVVNFAGAATTINIGASSGTTNVNNNLSVTGNLTVNGTTTTVNSTTLTVDDKNVELGSVNSPTDTTANGGGITLKGTTDKSIIWDSTNSNWTSSENWNIPTGKQFRVNNVAVLDDDQVLQNATTAKVAESATSLTIGASSGTTAIKNNATVAGTLNVTGNATFTGTVSGITSSMVGLGNVTNESKATMFASPTFTGTSSFSSVTLNGTSSIQELLEKANIVAAAANSTPNINVNTAAVWYFTSSSTANWTLNVRGDASTTLNSLLAVGQSCTIAVLNTNSGTAYYPSAFTIDGNSVTPKWSGGKTPSSGNASAIDVYTYTIIKTAASTYTVLASQTKFA